MTNHHPNPMNNPSPLTDLEALINALLTGQTVAPSNMIPQPPSTPNVNPATTFEFTHESIPERVQAQRMTFTGSMSVPNQPALQFNAGDWIIVTADGQPPAVLSDADFKKSFRAIPRVMIRR